MSRVVSWCLRNKSVVVLATLLLVGSGVFAMTRLNQELFPDIAFPLVTVATPVPGASPGIIDEQVTQPVEGAVNGVEGVKSVQSTSSQGFSLVAVEFDLDADIEGAEADIKDALGNVATLPPQAGEPEVRRQSAAEFPILTISLAAGDGDLATLTDYTRDAAIPRLEEVEGIGRVDLVGGADESIEVDLDPEELRQNNLPPEAVVGAIAGANINAPVGAVQAEDGLSTPVRVESEPEGAKDLEDLPIGAGAAAGAAGGAPKGGGAGGPKGGAGGGPPGGAGGGGAAAALAAASAEPVPLGDVAEVREVGSDISGISRTNREPSLGLDIIKSTDANTVEVARGVEEALDEIRGDLGEDQVRVVLDSASDVEKSVGGLVEEGLIGAFLAILVIFAFLRSVRATLVTAVSLPTSVLAALLFSWGDNLTLNILTLAGLTIAVGRVVDDAIVVLENSYRYVQAGYDPERAALKGTTEVASAITSSTLTTSAVFVPLGLVGGLISKFFVPLSLTVALALLASLIVSVTIVPVLVSLFIKPAEPSRESFQEPLELDLERTAERPSEDLREGGGTYDEDDGRYRGTGGSTTGLPSPWSSTWSRDDGGTTGAFDRPPGEPPAAGDEPSREETGPRGWEPVVLLVFLLVVGAFVVAGFTGVLGDATDAVSDIDFGSPGAIGALGGVFGTLLVLGLGVLAVRGSRRPRRSSGEGGPLVRLYAPMLRWSLLHRWVVLLLALALFAGGLVTALFLPVSFFPPSQENILIADVRLPPGTSLERTGEEVRPFEDFLLDDPAIESYQLSAGGENSLDFNPVRNDNQAQAFITVGEGEDVPGTLSRVEEEGGRLFGEENFQVQIISNGPPQGELKAVITGGSEEELQEASDQVVEELSGIGPLINVRSDLSESTPEVNVAVDPQRAAAAGVSPAQVSSSLGVLVGGGTKATLGKTPVRISVPNEAADSLGEVEGLPVGPGATVGGVADVTEDEAPSTVSRSDGERAVTVTGRITASDTAAVSSEAEAAVTALDLPGDVTASVGGESDDIQEGFMKLFLSIGVALALVYIILVVFFGSLLVPLVILLAVPLTTVGAFGALFLTNTPLSLPSLLGLLLLIGIVVSNAILLVDFAVRARQDHESPDEAVAAAGLARLRPILMTALATVFALLPLALGLAGGGSQLVSSSLAITVIGGLLTSTFLTLLVVPVGYSLLQGAREGRRKKKRYAG